MKIIGVEAVEAAGAELRIGPGELLTPLARDRARTLGVKVVNGAAGAPARVAAPSPEVRGPAPATAPGRAPARLADPTAPRAADARSVNTLYHRGLRPAQSTESEPGRAPTAGSSGTRTKVSVIGAGHVGSIAALRLAESDLFEEVLLVDVLPG
ncbi:MAG: malate dehydrogenase, partial [Janthinobacterium lividum]